MINRPRISFDFDNILLLFILSIGVLLRFYNYFEIPYTHDELSALSRLHYDNFNDLIREGIMPDGHPAGVQVFLYYYSRIFGIEEWVIKLPFLLMGVSSIFLLYLIGRSWFNSTTALLCAASIASLQFPIMYSQMARPYVSGLFLCLLLVLLWTRFFSKDVQNKKLYLIGFAITAALCAYNHYFSLLFAFIVGVTGLFFVNRSNWKPYILAGIGAVILYLPHLKVFLYQFNNKGLQWLAPPANDFLQEHLAFIFHYSLLVYVTIGIIVAFGILYNMYYFSFIKIFTNGKYKLISLVWFVLPIIIGFIYSIMVKPVIQYSMLIFSLPFLLLFLFSFFDIKNKLIVLATIIILLSVNIYTLIFKREFYQLQYEQVYNETPKHIKKIISTTPKDEIKLVTGEDPTYLQYYFNKSDLELPIFSTMDSDISTSDFNKLLNSLNENYLLTINLPLEYLAVARELFPYPIYITKGHLFELYLLSKEKPDILINDIILNHQIRNSEGSSFYEFEDDEEWGPEFSVLLDTIEINYYSIVDIAVDVKLEDSQKKGVIVWQLLKNGETIGWRTTTVSQQDEWNRYYLSNRLLHEMENNEAMKGVTMKVYYWNIDKGAAAIKNFNITLREGNRKIYGLIYRF